MAPFVALAKGRETARATHAPKQSRTAHVLKDLCVLGNLIISQWNGVFTCFNFLTYILCFQSPLQCFLKNYRSMSEMMFRKASHLWGFKRVLPCKSRPVSLDDPSITARLLMRPEVCYYADTLNLNLWPPSSPECECWQPFGALQSPASAAMKGFYFIVLFLPLKDIKEATLHWLRKFLFIWEYLNQGRRYGMTLLKWWINKVHMLWKYFIFKASIVSCHYVTLQWSWNIRLCSLSLISHTLTFRLRTAEHTADFHKNLDFLLSSEKEQGRKRKMFNFTPLFLKNKKKKHDILRIISPLALLRWWHCG